MSSRDRKYVNFAQDHELNNHLRKVGKSQSKENRATLQKIGDELKAKSRETMLTHDELHNYIKKQLSRLKNPVK